MIASVVSAAPIDLNVPPVVFTPAIWLCLGLWLSTCVGRYCLWLKLR